MIYVFDDFVDVYINNNGRGNGNEFKNNFFLISWFGYYFLYYFGGEWVIFFDLLNDFMMFVFVRFLWF